MSSAGFYPGKLWSLWDMLKMPADRIVLAVRELTRVTTTVFAVGVSADSGTAVARRIFAGYKTLTAEFLAACEEIGLPMCAASAERLIRVMERIEQKNANTGNVNVQIHPIDLAPMKTYMDEVISRAQDELASRLVLAVSPDRVRFFQQTEPLFGKQFETAFPAASYDVSEAGKCFALERPTASVFHLMRVMEVGVAATARCLGIPDPVKAADRNWGAILGRIRAERDTRGAATPPNWKSTADREFFAEAYALLDAVRSVWRNSTMHIENKYLPEETEDILRAVRTFMAKIASRMDENGDPKA